MNKQNTKQFLRKLLSSFSRKIFPFLPKTSTGFQISLCKSHKNSLSERLLLGKAVTRSHVRTEHTAVSQNPSFQVLREDISFFSIVLYGIPNITFQISQEQSYWTASWGESCNSVRWINRTQSSFSESFSSVFILGYFHFHHSPLWASKYHFVNSARTVLSKVFCRGKLYLFEIC